jgi:hypothetical protein
MSQSTLAGAIVSDNLCQNIQEGHWPLTAKHRRADNNDGPIFLGGGRSAAQWRQPKKDFTTEPTEVTEKRRTKKYGSTNKEP